MLTSELAQPVYLPEHGVERYGEMIFSVCRGGVALTDKMSLSEFYAVLAELQTAVIALLGCCPYCGRAPT